MADVLRLRVQTVITATPHIRIVRLTLGRAPLVYKAGQSVMLGLHGQPLRKPYSIACAPEEARREGHLEFLVKVGAHGSAGPHLSRLRRGAMMDLEGPFGRFHFPDEPAERHFLFIAGGTGIAPLRAMLWHVLLTRCPGRLGVIYSARSPREFAYAAELRRLARTGTIDLALTASRDAGPGWRGARGRISAQRLARFIHDPATLCFVCGPPALTTAVGPLLRELGIAAARIRTEEW